MHEQDDPRGAEHLAAIRATLDKHPPPDLDALSALLAQLEPFMDQADAAIAHQARQLELRILGRMLAEQAAALRELGQALQQMAQWLPPERPDQN